ERGPAPDPVVHARPAPTERVGESVAVHAAHPAHVPGSVVLLRPFALEHRFRPAVADLLPPIGAYRVAAMVPDHGGGIEAQLPAALLQPPAHVHVVAGGAELWIEPADRLEAGLPERHVAPGDVLGFAIRHEHVHRPAGSARDALRDRAVAGGSDVGAAHAGIPAPEAGGREVREPVRVGV